jgi:hypothetical protein
MNNLPLEVTGVCEQTEDISCNFFKCGEWKPNISCSTLSQTAFCVIGIGLFAVVKRPERGAHHPPPSTVGLRMGWRWTSVTGQQNMGWPWNVRMDLWQIVIAASTGLFGVMRNDMSELLMRVAR